VGTAIVSGTVVNSEGGRPIRRATVRLAGAMPVLTRTATTDDMGNFQFKDLPAGQFTLSASKTGYLDATYGQRKPGNGAGTPLAIANGQRLEHLALPMPRGGAISGVVVDEGGEPAYLTLIRAMRYVWRGGERTLVTAGSAAADDRGVYRIPVLPSGDYIIMATPLSELPTASLRLAADSFAAGRSTGSGFAVPFLRAPNQPTTRTPDSSDAGGATGYAPIYFPTTTIASAAGRVTLGAGEERSGIDLQLQLVLMGRVVGTIGGADQTVIGRTTVTLLDPQGLPGMNAKTSPVGPDGSFSFTEVAPGSYRLNALSRAPVTIQTNTATGQTFTVFARGAEPPGLAGPRGAGGPPAPESMWATTDVVVDGRLPTTAALALQPGMTVGGTLAFSGASSPPANLMQVRVVLSSVDENSKGLSATSQCDASGRFTVSGVAPGRYGISLIGVGTWQMKSAEIAGLDAIDFPLDVKPGENIANAVVTLTDRVSGVSGTLQDSLARPASGHTLIVFADDSRFWVTPSRRIMATTPASDGTFSFSNLPAGNYRLIAVDDVEEGQWFDPAFLRQLSGAAMSLTLTDGERKTQNIRIK
jgi:hypothetical protein